MIKTISVFVAISTLIIVFPFSSCFANNLLPAVDLSLIKTVNNPTPQVGETVEFTVMVENDGPLDATDIVIKAYVKNGYFNVANISNGGTLSQDTITWNIDELKDNQKINLTYLVDVKAKGNGIDFDNTAEVFAIAEYDRDSTPGNGPDPDGDGLIGPLDDNPNDGSIDPNGEDDSDNEPTCPINELCEITVSIDEPNPICLDDCTLLTANALNQIGSVAYKWSDNLGTNMTVQVCPTQTTIYSVTVTDDLGCTATAEVTVNVKCLNPPTLLIIGGSDFFECTEDPDFGELEFGGSCVVTDVSFSDQIISVECPNIIKRTWIVLDECNNSSSIERTVTSTDETAPEITNVPNDITVSCPADVPGQQDVDVSDNCDQSPSIDFSQTAVPDCLNGEVINTWSATDCYGNNAIVNQIVTILDQTGPTFLNAPGDVTVECNEISIAPSLDVVDNCDQLIIPVYTESIEMLACPSDQIISRTWTATDCNGNVTIHVQKITSLDQTPPAFSNLGDDGEYPCGEDPIFAQPTASDECGEVTMSFEDSITDGVCGPIITRTWIATDECGNVASTSQSMSQSDTIPPVIEDVQNGNFDCSLIPDFLEPEAYDNCSETTISFIDDFGAETCAGKEYIRTWIATDKCGNTTTAVQVMTPIDNNTPSISGVGEDGFYNCEDLPVFSTPTADDLCSEVTFDYVDQFVMGSCTGSGTARLWTATDLCGNTATAMQTLIPQDLTAPEIINLGADAEYLCGTVPNFSEPTAIDNCSDPDLSFVTDFITETCAGSTLTRVWTATDECGNTTTGSQTLTAVDNEPPTITGVTNNGEYICGMIPPFSDPTASDNCSEATLSFEDVAGGLSCAGVETIRTWTATDKCGNVSTASQIMTPIDFTPPTISGVGPNGEFECGSVPPFSEPTASDDCSNATLSFLDENLASNCAGTPIKRTWTATDECGNVSTASQIMTALDYTAPTWSMIPPNGEYICGEAPVFGNPIASDECSTVEIEIIDTAISPNCAGIGVVRTWIATDDCGNSASISQTLSPVDNEAPIISGIDMDGSFECGTQPVFSDPIVTDNCGIPDLSFEDEELNNNCSGGIITRTWLATDNCGNTTTAVQVMNSYDTTPPMITEIDPDGFYNCADSPIFNQPTATDNCSNLSYTFIDRIEVGNCAGDIVIRTWTVTDDCGNSAIAEVTQTPLDEIGPEITNVGSDSMISCNDTAIFSDPTAVDNCTSVSLVFDDEAVRIGCTITTTRTWTATDECGNTTTAQQIITSSDDEAPQIIGVGDDGTFNCGDAPVFSIPTAEDNCSSVILTFEDNSVIVNCEVTVTRTWTATDECGNISQESQTMVAIDDVPPVFSNVGDDGTFDCGDLPVFMDPDVQDCNNYTLTNEDLIVGTVCAGDIIKRTWTAIDDCGNSAQVSQTLEPVDNESPVFEPIDENVVFNCGEPFIFDIPVVTDNCGEITITYVQDPGSKTCTPDGVTRIWTATDECGNSSTIKQTFTPIDTIAPVITGVGDGGTIECGTTPPFSTPEAEDECSYARLDYLDTRVQVDCDNWSITRTWTAKDGCENTSTASETFIIVDTTAPQINNLEDIIEIDCSMNIGFPDLDVSDECGGVTVSFTDLLGPDNCNGGDIIRTWTATDECGNAVTATQTLQITDNTPPVFNNTDPDGTYECGDTPVFGDPSATDNCSNVTLTFIDTPTLGNCAGPGTTRTWTATDDCGNSSSYSQTLEPMDNTAPVITLMGDDDNYNCDETPEFGSVSATDNCSVPTISFVEMSTTALCGGAVVTRVWTATDDCGNTASVSQTLTPVDNEGPEIIGVGNDGEFFCGTTPVFSIATATDNCSTPSLDFVDMPTTGNCSNEGIIRLWTATDDCGNVTTASQTMESIDIEAPILTGIGNDGEFYCGDLPIFSSPTATDDCSNVSLSFVDTPTAGNCAGEGITRTWTATDDCGNATTGSQTLEPVDNVAPVLSGVNGDGTFLCGDDPVFANPIATDECSETTITFIDTPSAGTCAGPGVLRTWTATDECGNTSTIWQTMNPVDDIPPVITVIDPITEIECGNDQGFCGDYKLSTVILNLDNCESAVNNNTHIDYSEFTGIHNNTPGAPTISNTHLYRLMPNVNAHSCAPGINGTPAMCVDIYDQCQYEAGNNKAILIDMDVDPAVTGISILSGISFFENAPLEFNFLNGPSGPNNFPTQFGLRILIDDVEVYLENDLPTSNGWSYENFLLADQNIEINNTTKVTFEILPYCPVMNGAEMSLWDIEHIVVSFVSQESILNCVEATDNCSMVNLDYVDENMGTGCAGDNVNRIWTATDGCGNTATASQTLMLIDTQGPIITGVDGDRDYYCGDDPVFSEPETFDLCGNASLSFSDSQDLRSTTRTWIAVDDCGNTTQASQTLREVNCLIDLELDKSSSIIDGTLGDKVLFTIEVFNNSSLTANEVVALDKISASFDLISYDLSQGIYNPISGLWTIGSIDPFETVWLEIEVYVIYGMEHINQASIVSAYEDDIDSEPNNRVDTNLDGNFSDDPFDEDDGDGVRLNITDHYSVKVYPQPIINNAVIDIFNHSDAEIGWQLYNTTGKMIENKTKEMIPIGQHKFELNVADLSSGTYILKVNFGNRKVSKKLIIID